MEFHKLESINQALQELFKLLNELEDVDSITADQIDHNLTSISEIIQEELEDYQVDEDF